MCAYTKLQSSYLLTYVVCFILCSLLTPNESNQAVTQILKCSVAKDTVVPEMLLHDKKKVIRHRNKTI